MTPPHCRVCDRDHWGVCWTPPEPKAAKPKAKAKRKGQVIKLLKPKLKPMGQKLKSTRQIRDTRYSPDATVRAWYKSARWQELRQQVLVRDLYTCQHTGILLAGKAPEPDSPVVHHKTPHKGDETLFFDIDNLELVSKAWHDSEAQRQERKA